MIDFQVKIAGAAGEGVMAVGLLFAKALNQARLFVYNYSEYPSLIRGGHNTSIVRASDIQIGAIKSQIEVLVALNSESFELHDQELVNGGILIWDQSDQKKHLCPRSRHCIHVPLRELSAQIGNPIVSNTIALGALAASLNFPLKFINRALEQEFGRKGEKIVKMNQDAASLGFEEIQKNYKEKPILGLSKLLKGQDGSEDREGKEKVVITGNEACALGAIAANCRFYAGYPMTPSTGIFHSLAELGPKIGLTFKQTEDEISAINMVIGASYAGVRSITSTSGGGFALMTEALGLAAMIETPLVVVEAARPGPATGLPTWTEQGDLRQILHAGQGDFPRVILTPGDSDEAMRLTHLAFQLADEFQIPAIVSTDKSLAESSMTAYWPKKSEIKNEDYIILEKFLKNYERYKVTASGVSPRSIPGRKEGLFIVNSDEHDEAGFSREDAETRQIMQSKRWRKLDYLKAEIDKLRLLEVYPVKPKKANLLLFGFGSTKWPIREAVDLLRAKKIDAYSVHLKSVWPLPTDITHFFDRSKKNIIIENNISGQLEGLLKQEMSLHFDDNIRKFDGRPFTAEEIVEQIKN